MHSDVHIGVCCHLAAADSDQTVTDASCPDVAVGVGVDALDGVCRQRGRVSGDMGEGLYVVGFGIYDVDSSTVSSCPDP